MPKYTLTVLDTAAIQNYVFGSNVLRENIGGSELVWQATRQRAFQAVRVVGRTNVRPGPGLSGDRSDLIETLQIERDGLDVEVVYAGGGNCAILFADRPRACVFVTQLSIDLLEEAPGLELVVAHEEVDWRPNGDALSVKMDAAFARLSEEKLARRVSMPLLGLGVTAACGSTGLPAVGTDAEDDLKPPEEPARMLSAEILAKLNVVREANGRLESYLPQFARVGLKIPHDLDDLGRSREEASYLAVVHADGNSMGERARKLRADFPTVQDNRPYITALRDFAVAVENASRAALLRLGDVLLRHWDPKTDTIRGQADDGRGGLLTLQKPAVALHRDDEGIHYAPFRPIVFGGDDLTFVTDGRLGLGLAAHYLAAFERAVADQQNPYLAGLQACAGVAVVKVHYPFSRAYDLAEGLCKNAKRTFERKRAALDWHFAAAGLFGDVKLIRERQYEVRSGDLVMRPVALDERPAEWRAWSRFASAVKELTVLDPKWTGARNKVIGLLEPLRAGPEAVAQYRHAYGLPLLPQLSQEAAVLQETGWSAGRCGHFDVIEAMDFYLPLDG